MQQIYRVAARNQHESARLIVLDEAADLKDCPQQAQVQKTAQRAKELYFQAEAQQLLAGADLADPQAAVEALIAVAQQESSNHLDPVQESLAQESLHADLFGLGPLEVLLDQPGISDIFVNDIDQVWFEAAGRLQRAPIRFAHQQQLRALACRLITAAGGRLDDACPAADVQNSRGHRIHAVLPPLSRGSVFLSIRIQPQQRPRLADLQQLGMFEEQVAELLRFILAQRKNFLISGGTGTGKTTLLNALLGECAADERIITIEDSAELAPDHAHVLSLQTRLANAEGLGQVGLADLTRQALRMRPSRLVLGECRGAEVVDMLTAMNTGHCGSGGTVHANSVASVPARLYAMGALAGLSATATALQAASALDYLVHIERQDGRRYLAELAGLVFERGRLRTRRLCWSSAADCRMQWTDAGLKLRRLVEGG